MCTLTHCEITGPRQSQHWSSWCSSRSHNYWPEIEILYLIYTSSRCHFRIFCLLCVPRRSHSRGMFLTAPSYRYKHTAKQKDRQTDRNGRTDGRTAESMPARQTGSSSSSSSKPIRDTASDTAAADRSPANIDSASLTRVSHATFPPHRSRDQSRVMQVQSAVSSSIALEQHVSFPFKTFSVLFSLCAVCCGQLGCQFSSSNHASYYIISFISYISVYWFQSSHIYRPICLLPTQYLAKITPRVKNMPRNFCPYSVSSPNIN